MRDGGGAQLGLMVRKGGFEETGLGTTDLEHPFEHREIYFKLFLQIVLSALFLHYFF